MPDWDKVMSTDANKNALNLFLCDYIEKNIEIPQTSDKISNKKLYIAGGYKNHLVTKEVTNSLTREVTDLFSNHDEADSRIICHLIYISKQYLDTQDMTVIVKSPDTDVFILLIAHYFKINTKIQVWFQTGKNGFAALYTNTYYMQRTRK